MSNLIEAAPEEPGNGSSGQNRAFILIALGLAALLVIGLLSVFGYVVGTRLGYFGTRALVTPETTTVAVLAAGTATSAAGATPSPATTTSASAAATSAAGGTRVPGATPDVGTPTPTRVVGGAGSTPAPAVTNAAATSAAATRAATNTLAPGAPTPTNTSVGVISGGAADATPTPVASASGSNLPTTGVELDILAMGVLMIVLLVIARSFRMALRG